MAESDRQSDAALVERARSGDSQAFRLLVEKYEGVVAATVIGMLGYGADADDVGQETFVRFYRALGKFRGESTVGTYLTRIAINQSLKAIKKRKTTVSRFASIEDETTRMEYVGGDLNEDLDERERRDLVHGALQKLGPDHRSVVVLRMLQGYSTGEAAKLLGVPEGTVMSRLSRALENLQSLLAPVIKETAN